MSEERRLRASVVCEAEGHVLLVRLKDPATGLEGFYPPGGAVEPGEAPADTATRETLEETGLRVSVDPKLELVDHYPFHWNARDYDCTTHYFAAELEGRFELEIARVKDADYNLGAAWLPSKEGLAAVDQFPRIGAAMRRLLGRARRARWRRDPNLSGPGAMLLAVHDHFRVTAERLVHLVDEPGTLASGWLARAFRPLAETLHHHHHLEEILLFPRMTEGPELTADHAALTAGIDAVYAALQAAAPDPRATLARFSDVLVAHLDREEALVIPMFAAMSPSEVAALFG